MTNQNSDGGESKFYFEFDFEPLNLSIRTVNYIRTIHISYAYTAKPINHIMQSPLMKRFDTNTYLPADKKDAQMTEFDKIKMYTRSSM